MAGPSRRASTGDRRVSARLSMHARVDDEDDYDLQALGISDGFRPSENLTRDTQSPARTSQHGTYMPERRPTTPPRPSSATKPKRADSFALRHDGAMGSIPGRNLPAASASNPGPLRSSTISTESAYVPFETPYQGPSGPSHPYQIYPQESRLARTASVVTSSTMPALERSYVGPGGPTHPYGMYPQNIVPEAEGSNDATPEPPVPVGFPGLNSNYRRRLGPDGEEVADIIGPDGHTEQLPPYSQYPEDALARKTRPAVHVPVAPVAGAGGIGLATRDPEFESREQLNSPQSRQSTRSMSSEMSNHQVNTAAARALEKPELKQWQIAMRRKLCGIVPMWALVMMAVLFFIFAIILAASLAALTPKHPPKHGYGGDNNGTAESIVYTTMTTTFDATPYTTTVSGLASLPTGSYALTITAPSTIQSGCLRRTEQSKTWSCSISGPPLEIFVDDLPGVMNSLANNEVIIRTGNYTMMSFPYGAQPPVLDDAQVLSLVDDSQEPNRGPAWFFQTTYNKLVILPEDFIDATNSKRDAYAGGEYPGLNGLKRKGVAQAGDTPWFCYWNGTLIEAFLYVNLTSSEAFSSQTATAEPNSPRSSTSSAAMPSNTSLPPSNWGPSYNYRPLPPYPKVIKIQERRIPRGDQAIPPYCTQQIINPDGTATPALNSSKKPIIVYLNETEPTEIMPIHVRSLTLNGLEANDIQLSERQSSSSCGCVWLAT